MAVHINPRMVAETKLFKVNILKHSLKVISDKLKVNNITGKVKIVARKVDVDAISMAD